ncbi:MAG TPA: (Fe-S)-binding protein [Saprospiraceae bacterium]|nr:(Fe-S)-binding protein [Saprospiraceae bacterium]HNT21993.1 (Fe-S)-binding protein [Saprospiraceae bacterium]
MDRIKTVSEYISEGERPEILFWVGCAGSFDPRAQQVSRAFASLMKIAGIRFAILGDEEKCTGDPARRAGNEFLFQLLALQNIETLKNYEITKIVTTCPHCFNTLKNEYPALGGHYEVVHHTVFLNDLLRDGRLKLAGEIPGGALTYHDSCYLGRINGIYEDPREIMKQMNADIREMKRSKAGGLCCGAGGGQMFKEDEAGSKRINLERVEEALSTGAGTIVSNCPFCLTMLTDGVKALDQQEKVMVYDLAELILQQKSP